jgi:hypothetical protein
MLLKLMRDVNHVCLRGKIASQHYLSTARARVGHPVAAEEMRAEPIPTESIYYKGRYTSTHL